MHKIFKTQYKKLLNKFFKESNLKISEKNFDIDKVIIIIRNKIEYKRFKLILQKKNSIRYSSYKKIS
jgi:hypothetical protein